MEHRGAPVPPRCLRDGLCLLGRPGVSREASEYLLLAASRSTDLDRRLVRELRDDLVAARRMYNTALRTMQGQGVDFSGLFLADIEDEWPSSSESETFKISRSDVGYYSEESEAGEVKDIKKDKVGTGSNVETPNMEHVPGPIQMSSPYIPGRTRAPAESADNHTSVHSLAITPSWSSSTSSPPTAPPLDKEGIVNARSPGPGPLRYSRALDDDVLSDPRSRTSAADRERTPHNSTQSNKLGDGTKDVGILGNYEGEENDDSTRLGTIIENPLLKASNQLFFRKQEEMGKNGDRNDRIRDGDRINTVGNKAKRVVIIDNDDNHADDGSDTDNQRNEGNNNNLRGKNAFAVINEKINDNASYSPLEKSNDGKTDEDPKDRKEKYRTNVVSESNIRITPEESSSSSTSESGNNEKNSYKNQYTTSQTDFSLTEVKDSSQLRSNNRDSEILNTRQRSLSEGTKNKVLSPSFSNSTRDVKFLRTPGDKLQSTVSPTKYSEKEEGLGGNIPRLLGHSSRAHSSEISRSEENNNNRSYSSRRRSTHKRKHSEFLGTPVRQPKVYVSESSEWIGGLSKSAPPRGRKLEKPSGKGRDVETEKGDGKKKHRRHRSIKEWFRSCTSGSRRRKESDPGQLSAIETPKPKPVNSSVQETPRHRHHKASPSIPPPSSPPPYPNSPDLTQVQYSKTAPPVSKSNKKAFDETNKERKETDNSGTETNYYERYSTSGSLIAPNIETPNVFGGSSSDYNPKVFKDKETVSDTLSEKKDEKDVTKGEEYQESEDKVLKGSFFDTPSMSEENAFSPHSEKDVVSSSLSISPNTKKKDEKEGKEKGADDVIESSMSLISNTFHTDSD